MERDEAARILRKKGWLSGLPSHIQDAWLDGALLREVARGESLFTVGDGARYMFGVASGVIGGYLAYSPDEAHLLVLYYPGSWAGDPTVMSGEVRRGTAIARADCTLLTVLKDRVEKVAERHPEIWRLIAENLVRQFDSFMLLTAAAFQRDPATRLLLTFERLHAYNYGVVTFDVSVEELGHMTGLTRNTVTRALHELEARGLVERGYRSVTITDTRALARALQEAISAR